MFRIMLTSIMTISFLFSFNLSKKSLFNEYEDIDRLNINNNYNGIDKNNKFKSSIVPICKKSLICPNKSIIFEDKYSEQLYLKELNSLTNIEDKIQKILSNDELYKQEKKYTHFDFLNTEVLYFVKYKYGYDNIFKQKKIMKFYSTIPDYGKDNNCLCSYINFNNKELREKYFIEYSSKNKMVTFYPIEEWNPMPNKNLSSSSFSNNIVSNLEEITKGKENIENLEKIKENIENSISEIENKYTSEIEEW